MQYRITPANAREMAAKSHVKRRELAGLRELRLLEAMKAPEPGQARLSRLWEQMALIDERVSQELARERPNLNLLKEFASVARILNAQALDLAPAHTNGHKKPAPIAAPPDPLA